MTSVSTLAKCLTMTLGALAVALALASPARADVILENECYAETTSRQEANRIARNINAGRVPGWRSAVVVYDAQVRVYQVYATRTGRSQTISSGMWGGNGLPQPQDAVSASGKAQALAFGRAG